MCESCNVVICIVLVKVRCWWIFLDVGIVEFGWILFVCVGFEEKDW